jgi:hypothetical protein
MGAALASGLAGSNNGLHTDVGHREGGWGLAAAGELGGGELDWENGKVVAW